MDVVVPAHVTPSIKTLIDAMTKAQVWLEVDSYIKELICIDTNADLVISVDTMHQYVIGLALVNTMMRMLSDKLDRGAKTMYVDAIEARVHL